MKINNFIRIIFLMICSLFAVSWGDLPPEVEKCKSTNNDECITRTIQNILRRYPNGNPDFGMPNVSAFNIRNLRISRSNPNSPVEVNLEFINCTVYGLEKLKILKTTGFDREFKNVNAYVFAANLKLQGDYEMTGKILLLPINGKGKGEVELKDSNMEFRVRIDKMVRDNKTYLKIKSIKAQIELKKMQVNFENLFNGNEVLSKTLNDVVNENWRDVWTELQDGIHGAMELIVENLMNNIFANVTLEEAYAD